MKGFSHLTSKNKNNVSYTNYLILRSENSLSEQVGKHGKVFWFSPKSKCAEEKFIKGNFLEMTPCWIWIEDTVFYVGGVPSNFKVSYPAVFFA